jgi:hypothetical protein
MRSAWSPGCAPPDPGGLGDAVLGVSIGMARTLSLSFVID